MPIIFSMVAERAGPTAKKRRSGSSKNEEPLRQYLKSRKLLTREFP